MGETSSSQTVLTKLQRIAQLAKSAPTMALTTLAHHIDIEWLHEAYRRTRKDGATGVDRQSGEEYAKNLNENLRSLLDRAKSGTYHAPLLKRAHIPKGSGSETRPIGMPTFEDKVLQRAVAMALEAVYETEFYDFSYGFRPGRSAHQALEALWKHTMDLRGGFVIEVDIRKFFDSIEHAHVHEVLRRRVRDGVILRLIGKWLNAGVLENGSISYPETGSPQGWVVSPLLANIVLHDVLDTWFVTEATPRMKGGVRMVRYADDFVIVCEHQDDARRIFEVLPKRFEKFGLQLHPQKTQLIDFRRPDARRNNDDDDAPGSFDFLGLTHHWGKSRQGYEVVKQHTAKDRFSRTLRRVSEWLRKHRHDPPEEQHLKLSQKCQGHYAYFGITSNGKALVRLRHEVTKVWQKWLSRRSQKAALTWDAMNAILRRLPLPKARVVHSAVS